MPKAFRIILFLILLVFWIRHLWWWMLVRNIELPDTTSEKKLWDIEIRQLPALLTASVLVPWDEITWSSNAFRQLAGFIFGDNTVQESIKMTAPVTSKKVTLNQKIDMTAPVTARSNGEMTEVSFVMPSKRTKETLPLPNNSNIKISKTSAKTIAVRSFSWYATQVNIGRQRWEFIQQLQENNITRSWAMTLAQYNDPMTPPRLRTNEWWVEVANPNNIKDAE